MRILMFGWEFPPLISGGLGTACEGIISGLSKNKVDVTMVLPKASDGAVSGNYKLVDAGSVGVPSRTAEHIKNQLQESPVFIGVESPILPYVSPAEFSKNLESNTAPRDEKNTDDPEKKYYRFSGKYGKDLLEEVHNYAIVSSEIVKTLPFEIIHAHDWLTFPAAILAKKQSGKPMITHIHATEFDRSGDEINTQIYNLEKQAMEMADLVITVSDFTKNILVNRYQILPQKISVIHNAVAWKDTSQVSPSTRFLKEKIVTYLGRITYQKGPEYFIRAAAKILQRDKNFRFVMAGNGDLFHKMVELVAQLSIADRFHFTGFLKENEVIRLLAMSDIFVMPSVSEPFGIVPLEAIQNRVPTIISKQSGVQETLSYVIKLDFWDTEAMANSMYGIAKYPSLANTLAKEGFKEIKTLSWKIQTKKIKKLYQLLSAQATSYNSPGITSRLNLTQYF